MAPQSLASLRDAFHAGGVGAGSPGCEATPGYGRKWMNNPGGVEGSRAFAPLPGCVFLIVRAIPRVRASHDPGLSAPIPPGCAHAGGTRNAPHRTGRRRPRRHCEAIRGASARSGCPSARPVRFLPHAKPRTDPARSSRWRCATPATRYPGCWRTCRRRAGSNR